MNAIMSITIIATRTSNGLPKNLSTKGSSCALTELISVNKRNRIYNDNLIFFTFLLS